MIIGMPLYDGVDLLDVAGPHEMFSWAGFDLQLSAEKDGLVTTRAGVAIEATRDFAEAPAYDVLWVPGGDPPALKKLMKHCAYLDFLIRQAKAARYVCSVCEGALLLAAAGLLDGYTITTHWAFEPCFARFPKVILAENHPRYCLDRNRLTGGGIASGLDEALALIQILMGTAKAQEVQQTTQYYPRPPVTSTIPPPDGCPLDPPKRARKAKS